MQENFKDFQGLENLKVQGFPRRVEPCECVRTLRMGLTINTVFNILIGNTRIYKYATIDLRKLFTDHVV